ncbi:hypothetical protein F4810DRAFT_708955 [Camillea tinctor]|nr:hypothetical protein F4810DRAFT_708955 [Camillea tinctor]
MPSTILLAVIAMGAFVIASPLQSTDVTTSVDDGSGDIPPTTIFNSIQTIEMMSCNVDSCRVWVTEETITFPSVVSSTPKPTDAQSITGGITVTPLPTTGLPY